MTDTIAAGPAGPVEEAPGRWRLTRYADVVAALADARLEVPAADPAGSAMARFRASVSRFGNGAVHAARRAALIRALEPVDADALRGRARERVAAVLMASRGRGLDLMPVLRTAPVAVLAEALGVPADTGPAVAREVALVAPAYPPGAPADAVATADDAVVRLETLLGADRTAALGCLLVQACEATAGLAGNVLARALPLAAGERPGVEAVLAETLYRDPPVRATVRIARASAAVGGAVISAGSSVVLDLAAASGDPAAPRGDRGPAADAPTFGAGPRRCPGAEPALALAAGAAEAAWDCALADVAYGPAGNLRVPVRLEVIP